jgi:hypothetical protein
MNCSPEFPLTHIGKEGFATAVANPSGSVSGRTNLPLGTFLQIRAARVTAHVSAADRIKSTHREQLYNCMNTNTHQPNDRSNQTWPVADPTEVWDICSSITGPMR